MNRLTRLSRRALMFSTLRMPAVVIVHGLCVLMVLSSGLRLLAQSPPQPGELAGYLHAPSEKVPNEFDAGFSMYVAAWPLQKHYPGPRYQTGLFGTWMHALYSQPTPEKLYSDIEGGLGWWRDTRFATETPKFIMGGVARDFVEWANGPGAGKGRDWRKPQGKYAVIQLTPWLLWPPDGLNLKQGTCGEMFGYGYLPLPLLPAKATTAGQEVPTGDQCWTLFLNTENFKGPVTFFAPYFWSKPSTVDSHVAGMFLDVRPSNPNRALQMETQHIPSVQGVDAHGNVYARIAPTLFPSDSQGESLLVHQVTSYNRKALWDSVKTWFDGGATADGAIDSGGAVVHQFKQNAAAGWKIYANGTAKEDKASIKWSELATSFTPNASTFGYRWNEEWVDKVSVGDCKMVMLPEYFRLVTTDANKPVWQPVHEQDVPKETGLAKARFDRFERAAVEPYVTPDEPESCWKSPGPAAGPFEAKLGDGSLVTYYWYRFADQPALLNADLTKEEREALQQLVEKLHRNWNKDRNYLAPPKLGKLAALDPALVVEPPEGLQVGFVPIATRQSSSR